MTSPSRRRAGIALAVLAVSATSVVAGSSPSLATTGTMLYSCTAPGIGSQDLSFVLDTNAPPKMYVGRTFKPTLSVKVTIPKFVIQIAQSPLVGVTQADATGVVNLKQNGKAIVGNAVFPRTQLPDPATDFPVNLPVPLPTLAPTGAGTITYTPGPLTANLRGYKENGDFVGEVDASCAVKTTGKVIDKVVVVKSPTKIAGSLAQIPGKKLRATATVSSTSGVPPTGTVTAKVYRGKKLLVTRTARLSNRSAAAVFPKPAKKGTYKVVFSYGGSKALIGSSTSKTFRIR